MVTEPCPHELAFGLSQTSDEKSILDEAALRQIRDSTPFAIAVLETEVVQDDGRLTSKTTQIQAYR